MKGTFFLLSLTTLPLAFAVLPCEPTNPSLGCCNGVGFDLSAQVCCHGLVKDACLQSAVTVQSALDTIDFVYESLVLHPDSSLAEFETLLQASYEIFDTNRDGVWNLHEAADYYRAMSRQAQVFDTMDVDRDGILSFREVTAVLLAMDSVPVAGALLRDYYEPIILSTYQTSAPSSSDRSAFWQYVANLLFNFYDSAYTGYITWDSYDAGSDSYAAKLDTNSDGIVTLADFIQGSFGNATVSLLTDVGLAKLHNTGLSVSSVTLTQFDVDAVQLTTCPFSLSNNVAARRLIQQESCSICRAGAVISGLCCSMTGNAHGCTACVGVLSTKTKTCFAGSSTVWRRETSSGAQSQVLIRDLQVGDYVQSKDGWSKVWYISAHPADGEDGWDMIDVWYKDGEMERRLSLSAEHLLYVAGWEDENLKRADQVRRGDVVYRMCEDGLCAVNVLKVTHSLAHDAYAPVTMDGSLVVSGVLASSYLYSVEEAKRMHVSGAMFRAMSRVHTGAAAYMTRLYYNVVYKPFRELNCGAMFDCWFAMPTVVVVSVCVTIATANTVVRKF